MLRSFVILIASTTLIGLSGCNRNCDECDEQYCPRCDRAAVADCCECVPAPAPIVLETPKKPQPVLPRVEAVPKPIVSRENPKVIVHVSHVFSEQQPRQRMRTGETTPD